ncbi:MAG TPA: HupE/UreJ family protein [Planctomycetota bacterium]|nr:HupE/UreJ family protein [Planctomycetota bacterium]
MILALLLFSVGSATHPDSLSSTEIRVLGAEAHMTVRCQVLSLFEVVDGLDGDGDGRLDAAELAAREDEVLAYVADHYRLRTGSDRDLEGGDRLTARGIGCSLVDPREEAAAGYRLGAVDVRVVYGAPAEIRDLRIEMRLFLETSPDHIDVTTLVWPDGVEETHVLRASSPVVRSDPTGRGAFAAFLTLGVRHILGGWDHIAFLVALLLASKRLRSLLWVVTAFTLAHSVTLALAALEVVDVGRYAGFVEALIALSIAYVAAETLVLPREQRARWPEAFVFGLVHGLGFAGFLGDALLAERSKLVPLAAFNLGVELGQVLIVGLLAVLLALLPGRGAADARYLAPPWLRRAGSGAVLALGLYWFFQRI